MQLVWGDLNSAVWLQNPWLLPNAAWTPSVLVASLNYIIILVTSYALDFLSIHFPVPKSSTVLLSLK